MDFSIDENNIGKNKNEVTTQTIKKNELDIKKDKDSLSVLNLLNIANVHIEGMQDCKSEISSATDIIKENLDVMSIKEILEYLKIKTREFEIHAKALRDIYSIAMRTELAKQFLLSGSKEERSIKSVTPRVNSLINMLQKTTSND